MIYSQILPTATCFDDALDFIVEAFRHKEPYRHDLMLVHAICRNPVDGQLFAHAWAETENVVFNSGLRDGVKVYVKIPRSRFYEKMLRPRDITRYTPRQAIHENHQSNHFGPWKEKYFKLTASARRGEKWQKVRC